jgi:tetratricopeptide (TPR) repeat protein
MNLYRILLQVTTSLLLIGVLMGCSSSEDRQAKYLQQAQSRYESGEYKKALVEVRNVLQINPKNVEARYLWALVQEKEGNWTGMHKNLLLMVAQKPEFVNARIKLGQLYYHAAEDDKALEQADAVLAIESGNADAHTMRGSIFFRRGDNKAAINEAQLALASTPGHVGAISILTEIYRSQDPERALAVIRDGIERQTHDATLQLLEASVLEEQGDLNGATEVYKSLIAKYPENFFYYYRTVKFYEQRGLIDEAEKLLIEIVKSKPEDHELKLWLAEFLANQRDLPLAATTLHNFIDKQPNVYELRFALGKVYRTMGQDDDAVAVYQEIIKLDDRGDAAQHARNMLVQIYLAKDNVSSAESLIQEILAVEPENSVALVAKARLELTAGNPSAAVSLLRTVAKNEPNSTEALLLMAQANEATDMVDLALSNYKLALETAPDSEEAIVNAVRIQIGRREFDSVRQMLDSYMERNPENLTVGQLRVMFYAGHGQWEEALAAAGNLAESAHAPAIGLYLKGRVLYEKGDLDAAVENYKEALKISPGEIEMAIALAEAYRASGIWQSALEVCDMALEQTPKNTALLILKAEIYNGLAEYEKAADLYEAVLSIGDNNKRIAANNLAILFVDQLLSEESLRRALDLTADFDTTDVPAFWDTRGWVLYHNKNYASALPLLKKAVASINSIGIFHYHLGMTHYKLNDMKSAKEELALALESDEVFTGIEEARKIVGSL